MRGYKSRLQSKFRTCLLRRMNGHVENSLTVCAGSHFSNDLEMFCKGNMDVEMEVEEDVHMAPALALEPTTQPLPPLMPTCSTSYLPAHVDLPLQERTIAPLPSKSNGNPTYGTLRN